MLASDRVALEVTGGAWEIVRILEPHVAKVIVVSPGDTGITQARAKTDRLDSRTLARLLSAGELDSVWVPDELTRMSRRRLSRREQLMRARTRCKNEIHAMLMRQLVGRPPVADLFGVKGRQWLRQLELPVEECETVEACMRQIEFLDSEIAEVERLPATRCRARRRGGRISKQGSPQARWALVEAAFSAVRQPGPLHAFYERIRARRGHGIAVVAAARKLTVLFWCLLHREEQNAHQQPTLTAKKLRRLELTASAKRYDATAAGVWSTNQAMREAERKLAMQAEASYVRMVRDWQASAPHKKVGASVTPGRA